MADSGRIAELEAEVRTLRAELAARRSDVDSASFLSALLEAVPAFILRTDPELRIRYINRLQPGMSRSDVLGRDALDFVEPEHRDATRRCMERVLETGVADVYQTVSVGPHGAKAPYEVFLVPVPEPDGRRGICMVAVDLTLARRSERALHESEEKLRLALAATEIGLWIWTPQDGKVEWDERMRQIMGRDTPIDLPSYMAEAVHPDDRLLLAPTGHSVRGPGYWQSPMHRIVRPDGSVRWVLARGLTVLGPDNVIERVVGGTLDVTEHRALEEQVRRSQRIEAIGHLTTGVAHNFNNVLTVLTSTLDLLTVRPMGDDAQQQMIADARSASLRAAEMVRQLMTFAGQQPLTQREARDVGGLVERAIQICRRTFDRHIVLTCAVAHGLPPVVCTESEIEQIVMNLLLNARDAVLATGRPAPVIHVTVARAPSPGRGLQEDFVRIRVADDGVGMSEEVLARVFDPFFTTKRVGEGTGLGLTTSFTMARELGGQLTCSSVEGAGATFDVYLPAATSVAEAKRATPTPVPPAGARVLLVDDEAPVRRAVALLLEDAGFAVETAAGGEQAVARLACPPAVDVVLLDRSMPGAPGESFLPRMRSVAPSARIVLFSGRLVEPALAADVDGVVLKPASARELSTTISAVLGDRAR